MRRVDTGLGCRGSRCGQLVYVINPSRDWRGGGRSSARETLARVAAAAIAKKYLKEKAGLEFLAFTRQIGEIKADVDLAAVTPQAIEANPVRCPDPKKAQAMVGLIKKTKKQGDSLGGVIQGLVRDNK